MKKIRMGKIDYINTFPVYYGLDHGLLPDWIDLVPGPPSTLCQMIKENTLHVSPVSSAFYAMNHQSLLVMPDLSISCHGEVMSVILMTDFPLDELEGKEVVLTQDSVTSAALVQLIFAQKGITPRFITQRLRHLDDVPQDASAAMIIGDAAMTQPWGARFKHRIDLGEMWHEMTGLPFVFALWVLPRESAETHGESLKAAQALFYESRREGYGHIDKVVTYGAAKLGLPPDYVRRYFKYLHCDLDGEKVKALEYFFELLHKEELVTDRVSVQFFGD